MRRGVLLGGLVAALALAGCPSNVSCPPGAHPVDGTCVECGSDGDCGPGHLCSSQKCFEGCSSSHPGCVSGLVCDVSKGSCVQCLGDADCTQPGLPACNLATHTCVNCGTNDQCTDGAHPICDAQAGMCLGCLGDSDCAAGKVCGQRSCIEGCNQNHPCPTGKQCDASNGTCVQCAADSGCSGSKPVCNPATKMCVACVPGVGDSCPAGQHCRPDDTCERGCKSDGECPGGKCVAGSCSPCSTDAQCAAGSVCQGGACVPSCSAQNPCGAGSTCCGQHCVDTSGDALNCGACGTACAGGGTCCGGVCSTLSTTANCGACGVKCGASEACCGNKCTSLSSLTNCGACGTACNAGDFCDGTACHTPTYPNFCKNKKVIVIYDGISGDNAAAKVMASTITANCPGAMVTFGTQTDPALVDQTTGEPLAGSGVTYVLGGGPVPSKPLNWLELVHKSTKVYFDAPDGINFYFKRRVDGSVAAKMPGSQCSSHADQFLVELVTDPNNGTLSLIGYGACAGSYGTRAAGWFYANKILPNAQSYPGSWYVFKWDDTDGDSAPSSGDTFTKLAEGN